MNLAKQFFALAFGGILALFVAGCSGGGGGNSLPDPMIRFMNSSPDSNPLTFNYDTTSEATDLTYLQLSSNVTVDDGDHAINLVDTVSGDVIDAISSTFNKDTRYLTIAKGLLNYGTENEKRLRLINFTYDKTAPNGTKARLLIIHAFNRAAGFMTPNIDFQNPGNNPLYAVTDISYTEETPRTLVVDSDVSLEFDARRASTENVYASATQTFDAGGIYLALITGIEGGTGAQAPSIQFIKLN